MAFYIEIIKLQENPENVCYQFSSSLGDGGVMEINRKTGNISIIQEATNDADGRISERAARALVRHWEKGDYPDKTCWAS